MAGPAADTSPPVLGMDPTAPLADLDKESRKHKVEQTSGIRALEDINRATTAKIESKEAQAAALPLPKMDLPPPPQRKETDPIQSFGSVAMVFAALGSLLTRQPATTALNAAAGVINGYRAKDKEAADAAFAQWKAATENALKLHDYQMEIYKLALGNVERGEKLAGDESGRNQQAVLAAIQANAASFKDDVMLKTAQAHGIEGAQHLLESRQRTALAMQKQAAEGEKLKAMYDELHRLDDDPTFKAKNQKEQNQERLDVIERYGPDYYKKLAHEQKRAAQTRQNDIRLNQYKVVKQNLDETIDMLEKWQGVDPTGFSGLGARFIENIRNRTAGLTGVNPGTAYADFDSRIATIKAGAMNLLTAPGSRSNPQIRAQMDQMVPGLQAGASLQTTLEQLRHLRNDLATAAGVEGIPSRAAQDQLPSDTATTRTTLDEGSPKGSARVNPVRVTTREEYDKVPKGTWVQDPQGNIGMKP